jgi:hypothetical protein
VGSPAHALELGICVNQRDLRVVLGSELLGIAVTGC